MKSLFIGLAVTLAVVSNCKANFSASLGGHVETLGNTPKGLNLSESELRDLMNSQAVACFKTRQFVVMSKGYKAKGFTAQHCTSSRARKFGITRLNSNSFDRDLTNKLIAKGIIK